MEKVKIRAVSNWRFGANRGVADKRATAQQTLTRLRKKRHKIYRGEKIKIRKFATSFKYKILWQQQ
jgi:hypothetical protein